MSIEDVKATIRRGDQALTAASTGVEKIGVDLAEVTALAVEVLHDSGPIQAEPGTHSSGG